MDTDPSLKHALTTASQAHPPGVVRPASQLQQVILYHWDQGVSQLVVPAPLWKRVLCLAHDPPLDGHLAEEKTLDCIWRLFYWPGINVQVQRYSASCTECQLHQGWGKQVGTLQPMPIVNVPFERIGIDIIGPLILSASR